MKHILLALHVYYIRSKQKTNRLCPYRRVGSLDVDPGRGMPLDRGTGIPLLCGDWVLPGDAVRVPLPGWRAGNLRVRPTGAVFVR